MQFLIHILTMLVSYGLKILMRFNKLLYYKTTIIPQAIRLIYKPQKSHSSRFFHKNDTLKFSDKTLIDNIRSLVKHWITCFLLFLKTAFQFSCNIHDYSITSSIKDHKKSFRKNNFGKFSVTVSAIDSRIKMQDWIGKLALSDLRPSYPSNSNPLKVTQLLSFHWILFILWFSVNI